MYVATYSTMCVAIYFDVYRCLHIYGYLGICSYLPYFQAMKWTFYLHIRILPNIKIREYLKISKYLLCGSKLSSYLCSRFQNVTSQRLCHKLFLFSTTRVVAQRPQRASIWALLSGCSARRCCSSTPTRSAT